MSWKNVVSNVTVEKGCWPKFDLDTAGRTVYFAGFFLLNLQLCGLYVKTFTWWDHNKSLNLKQLIICHKSVSIENSGMCWTIVGTWIQ